MKRSEMIQILIDAVYMASPDDIILNNLEAEEILTKLENAGMKPSAKWESENE